MNPKVRFGLFTTLMILITLGAHAQSSIMGFSDMDAKKQMELEKKLDDGVKPENLDEWMKYMTSHPHHVGSPWDAKVTEFMAEKFRSWGYDVKVETFNVLFPTPKVRKLELLSPTPFTASLTEPPVEGDPYSAQTDEALPSYNCYSIDGDVTGELVFVNYGIPSDYEELERRGIDVKGKIVIAKYAGSWRGIKPKVAAEKGAIGCLIYSDPEDDGYAQGDTYPEGAFKNDHGVQRGAVMDLPLSPGDPLTPGYGATDDAKRLDIDESPSLTKIPVLPISYSDALPLLQALKGPVAPNSWRGALPITYHIGPGPAKVHLKLEFNWDMRPVHDVIAMMQGSEYPDEWVIRGNHHDAWVHGAADPISGMVTVMEEARVVGELAKTGWKPKRTIVYCAWGGEEPGLLGSTEWVETYADDLVKKAVAYINTDGTSRGYLFAGGSHTLEKFFDQIPRLVQDPKKGITVYDRRKALEQFRGMPSSDGFTLSALGSGSDYSSFFQHLGIASLNLGFGGEGNGGEYHTMYDSYAHYKRFKDPDFAYGATLVKVAGRTTLRLADADVLPFEFTHMAKTLEKYLDEVQKLTDNMRESTTKENRFIRDGVYEAVNNPNDPMTTPEIKPDVPYLNFAPLQNGLAAIKEEAQAYDKASKQRMPDLESMHRLNQVLMHIEQSFTRDEGLPRRPWFRHFVYAPGFYTGYGVKTLPGVREAIEERNFEEAQAQIGILGGLMKDYSMEIGKASSLLVKP